MVGDKPANGYNSEMSKTPQGSWFRIILITLFIAPLLLAMLLTVTFFGHAFATGIILPTMDAPPELAEYERYHEKLSTRWLFLPASVAWLVTTISGLALGGWWLIRQIATRTKP